MLSPITEPSNIALDSILRPLGIPVVAAACGYQIPWLIQEVGSEAPPEDAVLVRYLMGGLFGWLWAELAAFAHYVIPPPLPIVANRNSELCEDRQLNFGEEWIIPSLRRYHAHRSRSPASHLERRS